MVDNNAAKQSTEKLQERQPTTLKSSHTDPQTPDTMLKNNPTDLPPLKIQSGQGLI
jgi:hypothetical protein